MNSLRLSTLGVISWLMIAAALGLMLWMDHSARLQIESKAGLWQRQVSDHASKSHALVRLQSSLGYGGLVHHVKQAVIGRLENPLVVVLDDIRRARQALADYREVGVTVGEATRLVMIEKLLDAYEEQAPDMDRLLRAGRAPAEVIAVLPDSDEETVRVLAALEHELALQGGLQSLAVTQAVVDIGDWMMRRTIMLAGLLSLSLILLGWFIGFRVVGPLMRSTRAVTTLGARIGSHNLPEAEHADEIADLTSALGALNSRLTGFQQSLTRAVSVAVSGDGPVPIGSDAARLIDQATTLDRTATTLVENFSRWKADAGGKAGAGRLALAEARAAAERVHETSEHLGQFLKGLDDQADAARLLSLNLTVATERGDTKEATLFPLAAELDALSSGLKDTAVRLHDLLAGQGESDNAQADNLVRTDGVLVDMVATVDSMMAAGATLADMSRQQAELMCRIGESLAEETEQDELGGQAQPTIAPADSGPVETAVGNVADQDSEAPAAMGEDKDEDKGKNESDQGVKQG